MIRVIGVGKVREGPFRTLIKDYQQRICAYHFCQVEEVKDVPIVENDSAENIKEKEAKNVLRIIKDDEFVILLDLHGVEVSSEELARNLASCLTKSPKICLVIAGSLGPGKSLYARANQRWKLSDLTFLHQMTKVIVLEQIYRAFKINHHEKYHK